MVLGWNTIMQNVLMNVTYFFVHIVWLLIVGTYHLKFPEIIFSDDLIKT